MSQPYPFEDVYLPIWHYHPALSPKFTELLKSVKEKYNNLNIAFNTTPIDPNKKPFNSFYHKKTHTLTLQVSKLSYYYALHELFHFITTSKKGRIKRNFGHSSDINSLKINSKEEITEEIKTIFLSSAWFNEAFLLPYKCLGGLHQFNANNSTYLCSLAPFGKYKGINSKLINLNDKDVTCVASALKWINETMVENKKRLYTAEFQYRDINWNDYLLTAECSIQAANSLKEQNFLTEDFSLKPTSEWKIIT